MLEKFKKVLTRLKSEYMKIIFPSKDKIIKDSTIVLVCSVILAGIIFLFDSLIGFGFGFLFFK